MMKKHGRTLAKQTEPLPLRAFVTGYTSQRVKESEFSAEVKQLYPHITQIKYPSKNYWKGYAFIDFNSRPEFLNFVNEKRVRLEKFEMNLVIKPHKQGKALKRALKDLKKRKLEIEGIPSNWDDQRLETAFLEFGLLENCYVKKEAQSENEFSNSGIVIFRKRKDALKCFLKQKIPLLGSNGKFLKVEFEDEQYNKIKKELLITGGREENEGMRSRALIGTSLKQGYRPLHQARACRQKELRFHRTKPTLRGYHLMIPLFQEKLYPDNWNYKRTKKKRDWVE